jgi:hypothetical protein
MTHAAVGVRSSMAPALKPAMMPTDHDADMACHKPRFGPDSFGLRRVDELPAVEVIMVRGLMQLPSTACSPR